MPFLNFRLHIIFRYTSTKIKLVELCNYMPLGNYNAGKAKSKIDKYQCIIKTQFCTIVRLL